MIMKNIILVKGDMRSGTNIVIDHFEAYGYRRVGTHGQESIVIDKDKKTIIHDHSIDYFPEYLKRTFVFLVLRKNLLAQALSQLMFLQIKESLNKKQIEKIGNVYYPKRYIPIEPFEVNQHRVFKMICRINQNNKAKLELIQQKNLEHSIVYFEDFVQDSFKYFNHYTHNLLHKRKYKHIVPTPYQAKDLVTNYKELQDWWKTLPYRRKIL